MNLTLIEEYLSTDYGLVILPRMQSPGMLYSINGRKYSFVAKKRSFNSKNEFEFVKEFGEICEKNNLKFVAFYSIDCDNRIVRYDATSAQEMVTKNGGPSISDL